MNTKITYVVSNDTKCGCHALSGIPEDEDAFVVNIIQLNLFL